MKIQPGLTKAAEMPRTYQNTGSPASVQTANRYALSRRFDSVTINGGGSSFEMELRGRIAGEVRTATSSGMVSELREQILSGTYQPDSGAIARKMLLLGEAV